MSYSDEEISKYLNILHSYKKQGVFGGCNPPCESFEEYMGKRLCIDCGRLKGHILGKFDINDVDRLYYQKKSIYHRKYYFEKKVNIISELIGLSDDENSCLYERLMELDSNSIKVINKKYFRKRMININYIIYQILEEMGCEKYKNIKLKISPKILELYNKWWKSYKEVIL